MTLHDSDNRLLGALAMKAADRLGEAAALVTEIDDLRPLRVTSATSRWWIFPRTVRARARSMLVESGSPFRIDPDRLLYALQSLHNALPPDFELQLVRESGAGCRQVATTLIAALRPYYPKLDAVLAGPGRPPQEPGARWIR